MKSVTATIVCALLALMVPVYGYKIRKGLADPAPSTWIIFLMGTGWSLVTYISASRRDFVSGVLNIMDVATVAVVLAMILKWGKRGLKFSPFEQWFVLAVSGVALYGLITGDATGSNVFTQGLIVAGYCPTFYKIFKEKRNTESFLSWGISDLAGLVAMYPALHEGNWLAALYAGRTVACVSALLAAMIYYDRQSRRAALAIRPPP